MDCLLKKLDPPDSTKVNMDDSSIFSKIISSLNFLRNSFPILSSVNLLPIAFDKNDFVFSEGAPLNVRSNWKHKVTKILDDFIYKDRISDPSFKFSEIAHIIESNKNSDSRRLFNIIPNTASKCITNREMKFILRQTLNLTASSDLNRCCSYCSKVLDSDHAFNCTKKPTKYVIKRHNDVLKKLALHAEKSGFDVKIEPRVSFDSQHRADLELSYSSLDSPNDLPIVVDVAIAHKSCSNNSVVDVNNNTINSLLDSKYKN